MTRRRGAVAVLLYLVALSPALAVGDDRFLPADDTIIVECLRERPLDRTDLALRSARARLRAAPTLLSPVLRERRWVAAFVFGLIHGFGFAGALKALNLPATDLALSLFGSNVGVEIGQLAIVAAFVPMAFRLGHTAFYRLGVVRGGSILIALIAAAWFVERAADVKLLSP